MKTITDDLSPELEALLPQTYRILRSSGLAVHEAVYRIVLTGSRGLNGAPRVDSDIDLTLLVDPAALARARNRDSLLRRVVSLTLESWRSPCALDTAAAFDKQGCGLQCFRLRSCAELQCDRVRPDCFGLYKIQKGFDGFVPDVGLLIQKAYPMLSIWERQVT